MPKPVVIEATHWLVLSNDGWLPFDNEDDATKAHCGNIEREQTSYLVRGHTLDANGSTLCIELIQE